jgi:hypothetical protein
LSLNAASTNTLAALLLPFSVTAHLPIQDVSDDEQTHFGAAQTHFGSCYTSFDGHQMLFTIGPKMCTGSSNPSFSKKNKKMDCARANSEQKKQDP